MPPVYRWHLIFLINNKSYINSCFTALDTIYAYTKIKYEFITDVIRAIVIAHKMLFPNIKFAIIPKIPYVIPDTTIKRIINPKPLK